MTATRTDRRQRPVVAPRQEITRLLVPLDGSTDSTRALPVAAALGERLGVPVTVVDCLPPVFPTAPEEHWVEKQLAPYPGIDGHQVLATTDVVREILDTATAVPGTVICMSSHGRSGARELLLGSVTREVVMASPAPVLVVGPKAWLEPEMLTVQVAYDGSPDGGPTLDAAAQWASRLDAVPWVTHVVDEELPPGADAPGEVTLDAVVYRAAERLRAHGLDAEWDVLHGRRPAASLTAWAKLHRSSLLVTGCHDRALMDRILGTVTSRLVHEAPCPVLIVGPSVEQI